MQTQDPTPARRESASVPDRTFTVRLPKRLRIPTGSGFLLAAAAGTAIATSQIDDSTQAWQLVILAIAAMACDVLLAFVRRNQLQR